MERYKEVHFISILYIDVLEITMGTTVLTIILMLTYFWGNAQTSIGEVGQMPKELLENSGHIFYNGSLVSLNDSGNEPILYVLDTLTMQVTRKVSVLNGTNIDWEDLAQDDAFIYVADIGNYSGIRTDLSIYKISKDDFNSGDEVTAETIHFSYGDQKDYIDNGKSDWDAEALTVYNDQLLLFTKQWISEGTVVYSIPKEAGNHVAEKVASYATNGLVAGATYDEQQNDLLLIAYSSTLEPFVLRSRDITGTSIFGDTVERIPLGIGSAQAEAITTVGPQRYFIGTEQFERQELGIYLDPMLYAIQFKVDNGTIDEMENEEDDPSIGYDDDRLLIYGSYNLGKLQYDLVSNKPILARAVFDTSGKMVQFTLGADIKNTVLDETYLEPGVYYLTIYLGDKVLSKAFMAH